ncbi:aromatic hydrocarbon degradation membrane protein [Alcanivorax hongdengensis A-11-3]|uniref:Aromatic hydrocarbon degradation membrane protein n=1 Tax=Alcanivorax hongdengensis A-11-3 TaxID=1177179 RepID=L0W882_9GAMM|nr:outer membrane protein transport protein [Alcanivorax hongdengensis]EKF73121.1 aromatic hydrocarbon degradation membrane protein [Alcanivorax hongdengensis A-11-3]
MLIKHALPAALAVALGVAGSAAQASMGNIGTTYGVLPSDVASAQALSLFNPQVSATYYNPAYLTRDDRGELTMGLMHAEHELRVSSQGGAAPPVRNGDVLQDSPSQHVLLGMKTDLTSLTQYDHPLYLGFMLGVEKYGEEMLAFQSATSQEGQYFEYGRQPLFLNLGGATQLWRGLDAGASARITLQSTASLKATTDLAGNTRYEQLDVSAKPSIRPILGLNMDWGESFCPDGDCWYSGLETALAFRGYSNTSTTVDANTTIPGVISSPGLTLAVTTLDSYQPNIYSAGVLYGKQRFRVGASVEMQQWSDLEDEFRRDTIKDQAVTSDVGTLKFKDIVIPRVGAEYRINNTFMVTGGVAYSESPLESNASLDVNYLDTDKWIVGLGLTARYKNPKILAYPVRFDFAYQYQKLQPRKFDLYASNSPVYPQPFETVEADGDVHVFSGSITLKF